MTTGKKLFLGCGGSIAIFIAALLLTRMAAESRYDQQFQEQLRLARAEGIPTTPQEYAASIASAPPAENAAPYYKRLKPVRNAYEDLIIDNEVTLRPSPAVLSAANKTLSRFTDQLALADEATKLPRCWFNRDWSEGAGTLLPEFASMKSAAKALALRGSIAAASGQATEAISDAQEILTLSRHAGEEGHAIAVFVQLAILTIGVDHLALWSLRHPEEPKYRLALAQAIAAWPKVEVAQMYRDDLINILSGIDFTSTPEGRRKLGLKEENVSPLEKIAGFIKNPHKAKVEIVAAERQMQKAYRLPPDKRVLATSHAREQLESALLAFPTALDVLSKLGALDSTYVLIDQNSEARRRCYEVALQALNSGTPPKKLNTSKWISPVDGKPITYSWDGHQMVIDARFTDDEGSKHPLKIPTDKQLKPPAKKP